MHDPLSCTSAVLSVVLVSEGKTHEPKAQKAVAYPGFLSMKHA